MYYQARNEFVALAILSPAIWLRLAAMWGQGFGPAADLPVGAEAELNAGS